MSCITPSGRTLERRERTTKIRKISIVKAGDCLIEYGLSFGKDWSEKKGLFLTKNRSKSAQEEPTINTGILLKYKARVISPVKVKDLKIWVIKTFLPKKAGTSKVIKATIKVEMAAVSVAGRTAGIMMCLNILTGRATRVAASISSKGILSMAW